MIPGKEPTLPPKPHLMQVTATGQELPTATSKRAWVILFLQNTLNTSTYDYGFGDES